MGGVRFATDGALTAGASFDGPEVATGGDCFIGGFAGAAERFTATGGLGFVVAALGFGFTAVVFGFDFTVAVLGGAFVVAGFFFTTGFVVFFTAAVGGMHSRKVMSSIAKSLPQPPGLLFIMFIVRPVAEAGILKTSLYCVHSVLCRRCTSPTLSCATMFPLFVCSRMVISGSSGNGHFSVILQTFIIHTPNS